jgi:hypothetical protein
MPALDLEALTTLSTVIVTGRVTDRASHHEGERIVTVSTVAVDGRIAAPEGTGGRISIVTLGGEVDGLGMWVPGESRLELGERYLLFARPGPHGLRVTGMSQGSLRIVVDDAGDEWVLPPVVGGLVTFEKGKLVAARPFLVKPVRLDRILERIRAILEDGP